MSGWPNWLYWMWSVVVRLALLPVVLPFRTYDYLFGNKSAKVAIRQQTVKNGMYTTVYTWEVDSSKPKCWVEGSEYKFNSTLVNVKNIGPLV